MIQAQDIPLERKCVREDPGVGGNGMKPMRYSIFNVTAYALVLSGTFSPQWDMCQNSSCNRFYPTPCEEDKICGKTSVSEPIKLICEMTLSDKLTRKYGRRVAHFVIATCPQRPNFRPFAQESPNRVTACTWKSSMKV